MTQWFIGGPYLVHVWTCPTCGYPTNLKAEVGDNHVCDPQRVADYRARLARDTAVAS